jgi:hypothetical protein
VPASELVPAYDESGRLAQMAVKLRGASTVTAFVTGIAYNEKGQRRSIQYGNGVTTTYDYERDTLRLSRLATVRPGSALQDLSYVYDPIGNIVSLRDGAQQVSYFNNAVVSPNTEYEYDALYQLTRALGREHIGQNQPLDERDGGRSPQILPGDGNAMQGYEQRYSATARNIARMIHNAGNGQFTNRWTREYVYNAADNRLVSTTVGNETVSYTYDVHGSMLTMPHLQAMDWDPADRLRHVQQGTTHSYYSYDGSGQRVRKVVEKQGGEREVRLYLGSFEIFRRYQNGALKLERETQHVMDDKRRIALVDTRTHGEDDSPAQLIRYQFANHLGTACLETDQNADVISYEEYHSYGTSSWQAGRSLAEVSLKRYRYLGVERDEESGLDITGLDTTRHGSGAGHVDPAGLVRTPISIDTQRATDR